MRSNLISSIVCGILALVSGARGAVAQDLFQQSGDALRKSKDKAARRITTDRSRLDLSLAPDFMPWVPSSTSGSSKLGVNAEFDYDFACGNFDIRANFRQLLTKEVGEETLQTIMGMLQAQIAKSAMVFLCETSPTLCQAFQHYRISANALLKLNYDRCGAIEEALDSVEKNLYTSALKECMQVWSDTLFDTGVPELSEGETEGVPFRPYVGGGNGTEYGGSQRGKIVSDHPPDPRVILPVARREPSTSVSR